MRANCLENPALDTGFSRGGSSCQQSRGAAITRGMQDAKAHRQENSLAYRLKPIDRQAFTAHRLPLPLHQARMVERQGRYAGCAFEFLHGGLSQ